MPHWKNVIAQLEQLKKNIPRIVGIEMVNHANDNLRSESFEGTRWPARKAGAPRDQGRRLLIDTGDGQRSIKVSRESTTQVDLNANDYMQAHNEGATISGTASVRSHSRTRKGRGERVSSHTRKMNTKLPERRFIGVSAKLKERIHRSIFKRLFAILK
jgi:phage gpG-like protein